MECGGLRPGETLHIRGKIYLFTNNLPALLQRYARDFPEQARPGGIKPVGPES